MGFGVNIPVVGRGFVSAEDIVFLHRDILIAKDFVYFSTSERISSDKAAELDYLLLSNLAGMRVLCDIVSYEYFPSRGLPDDSTEYSPGRFANIPEKHWFKLSGMKDLSADDTSQLLPLNKQTEKRYSNVEDYISNTGRLQIFYFRK